MEFKKISSSFPAQLPDLGRPAGLEFLEGASGSGSEEEEEEVESGDEVQPDELEAEVEDQPEAEIAESLSNLEVADDEKPEEEIADQGRSVFFQLGRILDFIFAQNLITSGCWSKLLKASRLWMSGSQIGWTLAFTVIVSSGSTLFGGTGSVLILKKLPVACHLRQEKILK